MVNLARQLKELEYMGCTLDDMIFLLEGVEVKVEKPAEISRCKIISFLKELFPPKMNEYNKGYRYLRCALRYVLDDKTWGGAITLTDREFEKAYENAITLTGRELKTSYEDVVMTIADVIRKVETVREKYDYKNFSDEEACKEFFKEFIRYTMICDDWGAYDVYDIE